MFYGKLSRKDKEDKLTKLFRYKREIETDDNSQRKHPESKVILAKWKVFLSLSQAEQNKIFQEWDTYYEKVQTSPIKLLFDEQREAAAQNNWQKVKEIAKVAQQMRENGDNITLKKPSSIDPWDFQFGWVKAYKDTEKAIKELQEDLNMPQAEEEREVWTE